jgi:hypothetical protein
VSASEEHRVVPGHVDLRECRRVSRLRSHVEVGGERLLDRVRQVNPIDGRLAAGGAGQLDGVPGVGEDPPGMRDLRQVVAGGSQPGEVAVAGQTNENPLRTRAAHRSS